MEKYNLRIAPKVLITTGAGNVIKGGADIWTNHFLKEVWPKLPNKKEWFLLIDSRKPSAFEPSSLPKGLQYHHHFEDPEKTDAWLEQSSSIHFLHSHYHKRQHIFKYESKFDTIFVHAYAKEMVNILDKIPQIHDLQLNTKVDVKFYDEFLQGFQKRVWVGCNPTEMFNTLPNFTFNIPNFYEFIKNGELSKYCDNGRVAYAARIETRKLFHWMDGLNGFALVDQKDFCNIKDTTTFKFKNIQLFQWDPDIHSHFMAKHWGIFHGAHLNEPFGYNIFQAVDWGKLPIINSDWCTDLDYEYRASNINEFHSTVKKIKKHSDVVRKENLNQIRNFLKRYDYKEKWTQQILKVLTLNKYDYLDFVNSEI